MGPSIELNFPFQNQLKLITMYRIKLICVITLIIPAVFSFSQDDVLLDLHRNAYTIFQLSRSDAGVYRDSKLLPEGSNDYHPASSAATGAGLVAEVSALEMGWIPYSTAEENILTTLKTITGHNPEFNFITNESGYPLHWFNISSGEPMWTEEYSTIDAAILTCGALFVREAFCDNDSIVYYANLFWESIDWSTAIQNPETGGIYRLMETNGGGTPNSITLPFNEYMIVAWLSMNQAGGHPDSSATILWNNHYTDATSLPTINYEEIALLSDDVKQHLSSFVPQFTYYYCHYFTTNSTYLGFLENSRQADSLWWGLNASSLPYHWGLGAGHCYVDPNYCVCAINDNSFRIYSPHIIAGFLPIYPSAAEDLLALYVEGEAVYTLPTSGHDEILWRRSLSNTSWVSNQVQLIDFSTMLFGLTEYLRPGFFARFNNFFDNECFPINPVGTNTGQDINEIIKLFPNPATSDFRVLYSSSIRGSIQSIIWNSFGQVVFRGDGWKNEEEFELQVNVDDWPSGAYYLMISKNGQPATSIKFIVYN